MPLITADGFKPDSFATVADDAALPEEGGAIVSLARFRKDRDTLLARNAPIGVRLKAEESPEQLGEDVHRLSVVALEFPKFRDGRAFSWARQLRTRLRFSGEVRAVGDFLYDQIAYQQRVGFNAWDVAEGFSESEFRRALGEITNVYQPSADGRKTIRDLRVSSPT
ncbi:MAG TPA: DUF934 domain-containing protein [Rhizomicrobium sp.]|jgi:uncharacterized protein (DUF934 family)